jgi:hypothetical protein
MEFVSQRIIFDFKEKKTPVSFFLYKGVDSARYSSYKVAVNSLMGGDRRER